METGTISTPNAWELQILLYLGWGQNVALSLPSPPHSSRKQTSPTGKETNGGTVEGKEDGNPAAAPGRGGRRKWVNLLLMGNLAPK